MSDITLISDKMCDKEISTELTLKKHQYKIPRMPTPQKVSIYKCSRTFEKQNLVINLGLAISGK
jgi:hypothetical protein